MIQKNVKFNCTTLPVNSCKNSKYIAIGTCHFSRIPTAVIWKILFDQICPFVWFSIDLVPNLFVVFIEMINNILKTDSPSPTVWAATAPGWGTTTIYSVKLATIRVWTKDFPKNTLFMVNFKLWDVYIPKLFTSLK